MVSFASELMVGVTPSSGAKETTYALINKLAHLTMCPTTAPYHANPSRHTTCVTRITPKQWHMMDKHGWVHDRWLR